MCCRGSFPRSKTGHFVEAVTSWPLGQASARYEPRAAEHQRSLLASLHQSLSRALVSKECSGPAPRRGSAKPRAETHSTGSNSGDPKSTHLHVASQPLVLRRRNRDHRRQAASHGGILQRAACRVPGKRACRERRPVVLHHGGRRSGGSGAVWLAETTSWKAGRPPSRPAVSLGRQAACGRRERMAPMDVMASAWRRCCCRSNG